MSTDELPGCKEVIADPISGENRNENPVVGASKRKRSRKPKAVVANHLASGPTDESAVEIGSNHYDKNSSASQGDSKVCTDTLSDNRQNPEMFAMQQNGVRDTEVHVVRRSSVRTLLNKGLDDLGSFSPEASLLKTSTPRARSLKRKNQSKNLPNLDSCNSFSTDASLLSTPTPSRVSGRRKRTKVFAGDFEMESTIKPKRQRLSLPSQNITEPFDNIIFDTSVPAVISNEASVDQSPLGTGPERGRGRRSVGGRTGRSRPGRNKEQCEVLSNLTAGMEPLDLSVSRSEPQLPATSKRPRKKAAKKNNVVAHDVASNDSNELDLEGNSKKLFTCVHCGEAKTAPGLKVHMALKHHCVWTPECPEGVLDVTKSFKIAKSIRCLQCDTVCHKLHEFKNHMKWCGHQNDRRDCEICGKNVKVMSYDAHVRYMHVKKPEVEKEKEKSLLIAATIEIANESISKAGRSARRAAVKARNKLFELTTEMASDENAAYPQPRYVCPQKSFSLDFMEKLITQMKRNEKLPCCYKGCPVELREIPMLVDHLFSCSHRPDIFYDLDSFTCLGCGKYFQAEKDVVDHVAQCVWNKNKEASGTESDDAKLSGEGSSDEDSIEDDGDHGLEEERNIAADLMGKQGKSAQMSKRGQKNFLPMKTFLDEHQWTNLFQNWPAKCSLYQEVPSQDAQDCLPLNQNFNFRIQTSPNNFSGTIQLDLFETHFCNNSFNVNIGGPVWAMAWCPSPQHQRSAEYLAIYTHKTDSETHNVNECSTQTSLIQIWKFPLHDHKSEKPHLVAGLLLNGGPIWEMKWCPTGAWEPDVNQAADDDNEESTLSRIGLLAVTCHSGGVHILSIPKSFHQDTVKFYRASAVATLTRRGQSAGFPCLCLDWHWKERCGLMAAGFGDGVTCLWDLNTSSPLLRQTDGNGTDWLYPYRVIRSHIWPVKGVAFCQTNAKFIVTCSADRNVKVWDLTEPECPLTSFQNSLNTGVLWPPTCSDTFACSSDECYLYEHNGAILCFFANNKLQSRPLSVHNATVWGMSFNDWLKSLVSCDSAGVVIKVPWISPTHKTVSDARQVVFLAEIEDSSKSVVQENDAEQNNNGSSNDNLARNKIDRKTHKNSVADSCRCICHSSESTKVLETNAANMTSDCHHCRSQRCLVFKDFSSKWKFSNTPISAAKQLPPDRLNNSLPCAFYRVAWNMNQNHHRWLAAGGQAGILRVKFVEDIEHKSAKASRKKDRK